MIGLTYEQIPVDQVRDGVERRLACTENLMMAIMDFYDGPKELPDLPHSHPHEQVSYVAAGEILFVMDDQQVHLKAGDVFLAPSGRPHSIQQLTAHVRLIDCFTPLREDFLKTNP
jgi:mannose-6-phosphate isomerase-like protein (cupin superfamily)